MFLMHGVYNYVQGGDFGFRSLNGARCAAYIYDGSAFGSFDLVTDGGRFFNDPPTSRSGNIHIHIWIASEFWSVY